nr:DUF5667 domain-containing protein [Neobacillus sp. Marseille-Q6967]
MKEKKLIRFVTTSVLASSLIFSVGTGVFANEGESTTEELEIVTEDTTVEGSTPVEETVTEDTVSPEGETLTSEEITTEEESAAADEETIIDLEEQEPSLVPGDFFYFVKTMTEKIRLAFTVDDYKEAQLLAEFAAERIAEANALIAEGKTADAEALLKEAIATQEQAGEELSEGEETADAEATEETEVETKLAHNIDSLLVVLTKVENPTAQQAIMKNIQKTFVKLDKKFARLEEKDAKFAEKMKEIEEKVTDGQISEEEATNKKTKLEKKENKNKQKSADDIAVDETEVTTETKEAKAAVEEVQKEEAAKQEAPAQKAQEKQQAAAQKAEEKQQKAAEKKNEHAGKKEGK